MAEKEARHKRLYKDSPKLERSEDGNMKAKKPSESQKKSDTVQGGNEGIQAGGTDGEPDMEPMEGAHIQELKDMHKRHQTEMMAYHKRHSKEVEKGFSKDGDANEKPNAGKKEIKEIDDSKEITE